MHAEQYRVRVVTVDGPHQQPEGGATSNDDGAAGDEGTTTATSAISILEGAFQPCQVLPVQSTRNGCFHCSSDGLRLQSPRLT